MLMQSELYKQQVATGKLVGEGVNFQRIRRITGYLVGELDRFNDAKRHEESERVKHSMGVAYGRD